MCITFFRLEKIGKRGGQYEKEKFSDRNFVV